MNADDRAEAPRNFVSRAWCLLERAASCGRLPLILATFAAGDFLPTTARAAALKAAAANSLFQLTNIATVHLRITAEQWEAMEPKGGGGFFGGGFRGGPRGPGGPGGGFGPAMFLAPV